MEKEDLMVGDWVMYDPGVLGRKGCRDGEAPFPVSIGSGAEIDLAAEGCYSPILLTSGILAKIGFVQVQTSCLVLGGEDGVYINEAYEGDWYLHVRRQGRTGTELLMVCDCVHRLQQALRLCGIAREIVLV